MRPYAQMNPRTKKDRLLTYNRRIHDTPDSIAVLKKWNLDLNRNLIDIDGIRLPHETLDFGQGRSLT